MRKFLAISLALATLSTQVQARDYYRHREYHGGEGNWIAPLVGGLIVGGMIGSMNNRPYYTDIEPPSQYSDEPVCRRVFVGRDAWGYPHYRIYCE